MTDTTPNQTDQARGLLEFETAARAEVLLPVDAHVIGEPVTVTQIRNPELPHVGLLATCRRRDHVYELGFSDVVFPTGSAGASLVARYRAWLGLAPLVAGPEVSRPHKVADDDIVLGKPVDLLVLACKSNALRCRLLGSAREVTLRTAVRDEIVGSIITITPKRQWTHGRHPYLSGAVSSVRIDASVLGLEPLALLRENELADGRDVYRLAPVAPASSDAAANLVLEAQDCIEVLAYAEADELLAQVLALDLRYLHAHALLGERHLSSWFALARHHFELGVAIGSLTVREDFEGVLPWGHVENRPFLRCLHGLARALLRDDRHTDAVAVLRRLLRLDPTDPLGAGARLAAFETGKTWRGIETVP
jgi:hypothetical protein